MSAIICEPEIFCPVCGCRRDPDLRTDISEYEYLRAAIGEINFVPKRGSKRKYAPKQEEKDLDLDSKKNLKTRFIVFKCGGCNATLAYDTKEESIKIYK